jgi:dTDP-4-dehydrorhamnose reductase
MLDRLRSDEGVQVVADQVGTPTWTRSLAEALWAAAEQREIRGVHHWTDAGVASWYDFAVAIQEEALRLRLLDRAAVVRPIRTGDLAGQVARPGYSVLDTDTTRTALRLVPPHWRTSLRRMLAELVVP